MNGEFRVSEARGEMKHGSNPPKGFRRMFLVVFVVVRYEGLLNREFVTHRKNRKDGLTMADHE